MKTAIFDDGAGNVHSLEKVLSSRGTVVHTSDVRELCDADLMVLPGVGAFDPAMEHLGAGAAALTEAIAGGLACLAICLGMQLLFDASDEGERAGLGVVPGRVRRLTVPRLPNIGWERIDNRTEATIETSGLSWGYYAHSFGCPMEGVHDVTSTSSLGDVTFPATIRVARTLGVQFHPEKSSTPGLAMLSAFLDEVTP